MEQKTNNEGRFWNKSGKTVGVGDFIVRKCDGVVMEIRSEFPEFFVVLGESVGSRGLSILNKKTNYGKFYLWTPNVVNVGDVLTSGDTVFVVESIENGESGLKFRSGIFMDDWRNRYSELHYRQEDKWFDANKSRPASSSAISLIAAALNGMPRIDARKQESGSLSGNKSSEPMDYGGHGDELGFYEFKR